MDGESPKRRVLSKEGRIDFALALLLLKDFKSKPHEIDVELVKQILEMADFIGVRAEYDDLLSKLPPFDIQPRD